MRYTLLAVLFSLAVVPTLAQVTPPPPRDTAAVLQTDAGWQEAKLKADLSALARIMADDFYEMNQNGNGRDKSETLRLWANFRITSLTTDSTEVRIDGDTALVNGTQTEVNATGVDRMVFTRVYVRRGGDWRLLSSMQFRNPKEVLASVAR